MGPLLVPLKLWNKNLVQTPKPNDNIHKKPPEVEPLTFLNFPYFFQVQQEKSIPWPQSHREPMDFQFFTLGALPATLPVQATCQLKEPLATFF